MPADWAATHRVLDGREVLGTQLAEVLVNVLVREVATKCDAVDLTVSPGELGQGTVLLPLLDELKESLEVET